MMQRKVSHIAVIFLFGLLVSACNKEKRFSNKLIKGESWHVTDISIDGSGLGVFGDWDVTSDGTIYDTVPRVNWSFEGQNTVFEWQFQEKGKAFQLNYIQLCEECDGDDLDDLDYHCYDLTGTYSVERHGKNAMEFITSEALGYPGSTVRISIVRNK